MIAVYAIVKLQPGKDEQFTQIAQVLIHASRQDKGCVAYHCGKIEGQNNSYAFVEQWQSKQDLQAHMQTSHFSTAVAAIEKLTTQALEVQVVELLEV